MSIVSTLIEAEAGNDSTFRDMIEASPISGEITQDLEVICGLDFDVHRVIVSLGQGQAGLSSGMRLG